MNTFFFSMLVLTTLVAHAFDSKVTFSVDDMKKNTTVVGASRGDSDQMLTIASRVFQLQLEASKCINVSVNQSAMVSSEKNIFLVSSKNCVIKNKKTEACDSGFAARNISENPRTPDAGVIGGETYKICIKDTGKVSDGASSSVTEKGKQ